MLKNNDPDYLHVYKNDKLAFMAKFKNGFPLSSSLSYDSLDEYCSFVLAHGGFANNLS